MRFELTLRRPEDVEPAFRLIAEHGITAVNITDISKKVDAVALAAKLLERDSQLDVMPHIACKHHDPASFRAALDRMPAAGIRRFLLVSGHPRGAFDTLKAFDVIHAAPRKEVYAVYNPYWPDSRLKAENDRLAQKLSHVCCRGICLQIGMDRAAFESGVNRIRELRPDVEVLASLPIPSESLLKRLIAKALYGVYLDAKYFLSAEAAWRITQDMARLMRDHGVTPVVFSDGFSEEVIERARSLM